VTGTNKGAVRFVNCAFWGPGAAIASINGSMTSSVGFDDCIFNTFDAQTNETRFPAAISLHGPGSLQVRVNTHWLTSHPPDECNSPPRATTHPMNRPAPPSTIHRPVPPTTCQPPIRSQNTTTRNHREPPLIHPTATHHSHFTPLPCRVRCAGVSSRARTLEGKYFSPRALARRLSRTT
jgi:hypothetical protein